MPGKKRNLPVVGSDDSGEVELDFAAVLVEGELPPPPDVSACSVKQKSGGRQFTRFEEEWVRRLLAAKTTDGMWRLSLILLRKADYWGCFPITGKDMAECGLTRKSKRSVLTQIETLGLIGIEWRGRRSPMVMPLHLTGQRMRRKWPGAR